MPPIVDAATEGERVASLETEVRLLRADFAEMKDDVKAIRDTIQQGHGAVRLVQIIVAAAGVLGVSAVFGHKIQDFLAWLGK